MPVESPYEKRNLPRLPYEERGLFTAPGRDGTLIKVRDISERGLGAYTRTAFSAGDRGTVAVKFPEDKLQNDYMGEVRWCQACDEPGARLYPYRVGFKIVDEKGANPRQERRQRRENRTPDLTAVPVPERKTPPAPEKAAAPSPVEPDKEASGYRVKGSMLIDMGKMVRRNHDKPWQKYLTMDDMKIVGGMIIPAAWYPLDTFRRVGIAVLEVFGQGRPESAEDWGKNLVDRVPSDLYKNFFDKNDPKNAIRNYVSVNMRVFDFMRLKMRDGGENSVSIIATGTSEIKEVFPEVALIGHMAGGAACRLAEKNGAERPKCRVNEDEPGALFVTEVSWR